MAGQGGKKIPGAWPQTQENRSHISGLLTVETTSLCWNTTHSPVLAGVFGIWAGAIPSLVGDSSGGNTGIQEAAVG